MSVSKEEKYAVVFGNEVKGVQQEVVTASDNCIFTLPVSSTLKSNLIHNFGWPKINLILSSKICNPLEAGAIKTKSSATIAYAIIWIC